MVFSNPTVFGVLALAASASASLDVAGHRRHHARLGKRSDVSGVAYYGYQNNTQNACGTYSSDNDMIIGVGPDYYGNMDIASPKCFQHITISLKSDPTKSVDVTLTDACEGCGGPGNVYVSPAAFKALSGGSLDAGVLDVTWSFGSSSSATTSAATSSTTSSSDEDDEDCDPEDSGDDEDTSSSSDEDDEDCDDESSTAPAATTTAVAATTTPKIVTTTVKAATTTPKAATTTAEAATTPKAAQTTTKTAQSAKFTAAAGITNSNPTSGSSNSGSSNNSGSNGSRASNSDVQTYLQLHNSIRSQHGAVPVTWSNDAAEKAQQWADECKNQHSGGTLGPLGENLAAGTGSFSITDAVQAWTDEVSEYNPSNPQPSHFTQVVWKATTEIGCAVQTCDGIFPGFGAAQYYVCEYSVQGNVIGNFAANVQA